VTTLAAVAQCHSTAAVNQWDRQMDGHQSITQTLLRILHEEQCSSDCGPRLNTDWCYINFITITIIIYYVTNYYCLQWFDAVGCVGGRASL